MDDICTQPTDTTGYVVTNNVLNAEGFDVSVSCATGYEGEPSVSACSESGPYTLEGCSPIMCELPELEYPILRNYGQSQNLSMGENFNLVSMCLQIDGISDTGVVLHESCTADNRIVEVSECELNTGYFYGPLQGIPVACASVENSAADATLTCTSPNNQKKSPSPQSPNYRSSSTTVVASCMGFLFIGAAGLFIYKRQYNTTVRPKGYEPLNVPLNLFIYKRQYNTIPGSS